MNQLRRTDHRWRVLIPLAHELQQFDLPRCLPLSSLDGTLQLQPENAPTIVDRVMNAQLLGGTAHHKFSVIHFQSLRGEHRG